jgi:thiamine biosynthesis lipoprotein
MTPLHRLSLILALLIIELTGPSVAAAERAVPGTETLISGRTMGTVYHVKIVSNEPVEVTTLKAEMTQILAALNASMSTYDPHSEISRLNSLRQKEPIMVSEDFMRVMRLAAKIYGLTGGAWDGTVAPLINLWGFGPNGQIKQVPSARDIDTALGRVGFHLLQRQGERSLVKRNPEVTLSLASIAKGYGVDRLADFLNQKGYINYLVEIGGEVYAKGVNAMGEPWRVGINRPDPGGRLDAVYRVVQLSQTALATSGDYRQFYEIDGKRYSHIIDPKTGYPVQNGVVSVSVMAPNCALADGLATALMVMGPEKGLAVINSLDGVEAIMVVRDENERLTDYLSDGLQN